MMTEEERRRYYMLMNEMNEQDVQGRPFGMAEWANQIQDKMRPKVERIV